MKIESLEDIREDLIVEKRVHIFNAGPAALPMPVLREVQENFVRRGYQ